MADKSTVGNTTGGGQDIDVMTDEVTDATIGTAKVQYVKIMDGTLDSSTKVAASANGLKVDGSAVTQPVSDAGGTLTVDDGGTTLSVDDGGATLSIDDGAGSITVDGTVALSTGSAVIGGTTTAGTGNLVTGQAAPTNSAANIVASRSGRSRLILINHGSVDVYVGPATVTTANGIKLPPGASVVFFTTIAVQGITASGTGAIHYAEEY